VLLILVPTTSSTIPKLTRLSASAAFARSRIRTICISTSGSEAGSLAGEDDSFSDKAFAFIGPSATHRIIQALESITDESLSDVFGESSYFRSYGGAANLCGLVAILMDCDGYYRFDDDCDFGDTNLPPIRVDEVLFGGYIETQRHPRAQWLSEQRSLIRVLDSDSVDRQWKSPIKSGCLAIPHEAAKCAPFPVWFDIDTGIKPRGEVYDWERALRPFGFVFRAVDEFQVGHRSHYESDREAWLLAFALKSELAFVANWLADDRGNEFEAELARRRADSLEEGGRAALPSPLSERLVAILGADAPRFSLKAVPSYLAARSKWRRLIEGLQLPATRSQLIALVRALA